MSARKAIALSAAMQILAGASVAQRRGIDVTRYDVSVSLPDTGFVIRGLVKVFFVRRVPEAPDTLVLNLVHMIVDSVYHLPFVYDDSVLRIPLHHVARGGIWLDTVAVSYHGVPRDGLIIGPNQRGRRVVFADNWPERARYWLPTVDQPGDKALVHFSVRAPRGWRVVANGKAAGGSWSESHPIPTYTMVIGAGPLTVSRHRPVIHGRDTIPMEVWAYPEDSAYADSVPFRRATEIVETMERLVGPFPYEKLAHVESSTRYGGMENSSAIFYAEKAYVERRMGEGVVRHETAHQWFGDAVTEREWHHLWLSEGFATYFDEMIGAALDGDAALVQGMRRNAESYMASDAVSRPIVDTAEHDLMKLLNANNYQKGSWVLHMLRGLIGDSAFSRGTRDYYRTYRDSTALSQDFQRIMERASGRDLDWFFRQWLWQPGYPQLDVQWGQSEGRAVTVGITQVQPDAWGAFRLPELILEFRDSSGTLARRTIGLESAARSRVVPLFDLPFRPAQLRVDPDGKLLMKATVRRADAPAAVR